MDKKLTIYIADDEFLVIEKLKILIPWEREGFELCGSATDGKTAYSDILRLTPDIVISDIRMPGYTGLQLVELLQNAPKVPQFILVSGFRDFDYAQTALRFRVKDYLLKPIDETELNKVLNNIRKNFTNPTHSVDPEIKGKLEQMLLEELFNKKSTTYDLEHYNKQYYTQFRPGTFRVFRFKLDGDKANMSTVTSEIVSKLRSFIKPFCHEMVLRHENMRVVVLLNYDVNFEKDIDDVLCRIVQDIKRSYASKSVAITVALGVESDRVERVCKSYESAFMAEQERIFGKVGTIIKGEAVSKTNNADIAPTKQNHSKLEQYIETSDFSAYTTECSRLLRSYEQNACAVFAMAEFLFLKFWEITSKSLNNNFQIKTEKFAQELDNCISVEDIENLIANQTSRLYEAQFGMQLGSKTAAVAIARQYIRQNYAKKLTLDDIAKRVYLNPVYFSVLFKREVGMSFINYVNDVRMEEAKKLLGQHSLSLYEIACSVGISDISYFSKVFKRSVGITPKEYRNKLTVYREEGERH